jgi:nucleotidyltransferase substrate binding protein (TIGR01987 family)
MSELSVAQLGKAIARLDESLEAYRAEPKNLMYRDAVIKRFEFTFEVAQSLLRRFVTAYSVNLKQREQLTFPTLIRTGSQDGVLRGGYDVWHRFRDARNRTSHAYNEDQAVAVVEAVPGFLDEVRFLYTRLGEEMADV